MFCKLQTLLLALLFVVANARVPLSGELRERLQRKTSQDSSCRVIVALRTDNEPVPLTPEETERHLRRKSARGVMRTDEVRVMAGQLVAEAMFAENRVLEWLLLDIVAKEQIVRRLPIGNAFVLERLTMEQAERIANLDRTVLLSISAFRPVTENRGGTGKCGDADGARDADGATTQTSSQSATEGLHKHAVRNTGFSEPVYDVRPWDQFATSMTKMGTHTKDTSHMDSDPAVLSSPASEESHGTDTFRSDPSLPADSTIHEGNNVTFVPQTIVTVERVVVAITSWNMDRTGAPQIWSRGFKGQGILYGVIDTGAAHMHPVLSANYLGRKGDGKYDHNYAWYDAVQSRPKSGFSTDLGFSPAPRESVRLMRGMLKRGDGRKQSGALLRGLRKKRCGKRGGRGERGKKREQHPTEHRYRDQDTGREQERDSDYCKMKPEDQDSDIGSDESDLDDDDDDGYDADDDEDSDDEDDDEAEVGTDASDTPSTNTPPVNLKIIEALQQCGYAERAPCDPVGHGTHVLSSAVGAHGVGMAPDSRWMACRSLSGNLGRDEDALACLNFFLAPHDLDGRHPRPELRPHVIGNSYGWSMWAEVIGAGIDLAVKRLEAAGTVMVFAAGNSGPACGTVHSGFSFTVGSVAEDGSVSRFSSRGPLTEGAHCLPFPRHPSPSMQLTVKPDMVAPGQDILGAYGKEHMARMSGTSMAAPHVAGAVALVLSACPWLVGRPARVQRLLMDTATPRLVPFGVPPCGRDTFQSHPNNFFGSGVLDVVRAIDECRKTGNRIASDGVEFLVSQNGTDSNVSVSA